MEEYEDRTISLIGVDSLIVKGSIPNLPEGLQYLDCSNNSIQYLPPLPSTLLILICNNCNLEVLPDLPDSLEYLDARYNRLKDIRRLPPKLFLTPMGIRNKNESENTRLHSSNLLLEGNELPVGFLNGYGSITEYSTKHVHTIIEFEGQQIYTMIIPKGTLLFRDSYKAFNGEELKGILLDDDKTYFNYSEFNVFFYPYPFVTENFSNENDRIHVFELVRDVEVLMGVLPSINSRSDRHTPKSKYMTSCNKIPTGSNNIEGYEYDPCFTRKFSKKYTNINGMFVIASQDTQEHIKNDIYQRYWSKYRTNFKDFRIQFKNKEGLVSELGVPEIILHPNQNRFDSTSPYNYRHLLELQRKKHTYDKAWEIVETKLESGEWTIDLFTKMYVNWNTASDEVKARCVPPEDPYKLRYLNFNYWQKTGGKRTQRNKRPNRRSKTRAVKRFI